MNAPVFSCIIPCSKRDLESQNLKDLIASIKAQDFPQDQIEILVITEGDSEQAKGIGIKQAKGEICAMFCADNYLMDKQMFRHVSSAIKDYDYDCYYEEFYAYKSNDNSLNRYFSLIGCNDPIPFYLGKCDRHPLVDGIYKQRGFPSFGCNGFFVKRKCFEKADLEHYYPMDVHVDMAKQGIKYYRQEWGSVWHRTSDKLIPFLIKRYKYARDLFCERQDRRWKIIDTKEDKIRLFLFCLFTITAIEPIATSCRGFRKIRDWAWFWHWPVCLGFLVTYTILAIRNLFKHGRLFQCASLQPA